VITTPVAVERGDDDYPAALLDLPDPPPLIWRIGNLDVLRRPVVAIVGTRQATFYGERVTREISGALARAGACVVSGMARGIDGVAHVAALDAGGQTAAVLGTGVDIAYPPSHRALHERIATSGLLLSELPPGAHSHGGSFPKRNRLIAALARLTIIVEAPVKSGALITARRALDLNRDVGIVPGPIDLPQCEGSNQYLRDGAHPITSAADALALVGLTAPVRTMIDPDDPDQLRVWRALRQGPADMDTLCHRTALPVQRCLAAVTALELRGSIECALTGEVRVRRA
jgi:DNA processing protein